MSVPLKAARQRPQLRLVSSTLEPRRAPRPMQDWRLVASAIVGCAHDLTRALHEHRWGNVNETLRERRELLQMLATLPLDADGRRCLQSLEQAVRESEDAIRGIMDATAERH